ncbi:MAG TPA: VWA domain-containing protein [Bryobacteraceae bacterium]|jgi:VWFA-related protein
MKRSKLPLCLAAFALTAGAQTPRALCLFFDLNSMTAAEQARAQQSALKFVQEQMTSADVVSVMTSTPSVQVLQDFTGDREAVAAVLRTIVPGPAASASPADRLQAIQQASALLSPVTGKKSLLYFSAGALQTGTVDADQLKTTVNEALRANVAIYPIDARAVEVGPFPVQVR